jgi:uncharacterized protein (TIGR03435 family)
LKNLVCLVFVCVSVAFAQRASFEVATIKPSAPLDPAALRAGTAHINTRVDAGRIDMGTASLFRLICTAYRLRPYQLKGPDWLKTTEFDVQATLPSDGKVEQIPEMLQGLLEERFGLKVHRADEEQSVYALVVAKGGPKLEKAKPAEPEAPADPSKPPPMTMSMPTLQGGVKATRTANGISLEMPDGEITGKVNIVVPKGPGNSKARAEIANADMKTFASLLSVGLLDKPVVDMTGLDGNYDIAVEISEDDAMNAVRANVSFANVPPPASGADPSGASIQSSIQSLGLRLESRKLPVSTLFVDHIEKTPSGN